MCDEDTDFHLIKGVLVEASPNIVLLVRVAQPMVLLIKLTPTLGLLITTAPTMALLKYRYNRRLDTGNQTSSNGYFNHLPFIFIKVEVESVEFDIK